MLVAEEMREKHKCKRAAEKVASHQYKKGSLEVSEPPHFTDKENEGGPKSR